ncbi:MAG TPA: MBL fold metallo-hydrolase [Devosiaceae bacterium]
MSADPEPLAFDKTFRPRAGEAVAVAPGIVRITAPNASPYTFTGTNSYLAGTDSLAVIDPGPDDKGHLDALLRAIDGRPVTAILLTHTHKDHSRLTPALREATGAPLWFGGVHRLSRPLRDREINPLQDSCDWDLVPDLTLVDGAPIELGGMVLRAIATPGHCANHLCYGVEGSEFMLTGDHVMGWNTTLVAPPDGSMKDYYASIDRMAGLPYRVYLPGHGGPVADGPAYARALKAHREMRDGQILAAAREGATTLGPLLDRIYPGLAPDLRGAAAMTLLAHVEYLEARGRIDCLWTESGPRIRAVR